MAARTETRKAPLVGRLEALTAVGAVGVASLLLGLVACLIPAAKATTSQLSYRQVGSFSYSGSAPSSSVYGPRGVRTGDPISTRIVKNVGVTFHYAVTSSSDAKLHGTEALVANVTVNDGVSRQFTVAPQKTFTGSSLTVAGSLPLSRIRHLVNQSAAALSGAVPTGATIAIVPEIKTSGTLGGHDVSMSYSPALSFALTDTSLALVQSQSATTSTSATASNPALTPSESGSVKQASTRPQTIDLVVAHPSVTWTRLVALLIAGFCLLMAVVIGRPLARRGTVDGERDRVRALYGGLLVPVEGIVMHATTIADVSSMTALAEVAKRYECMIMHREYETGDEYLVWDNGMLYRYRVNVPIARPFAVPDRGDERLATKAPDRFIVLPEAATTSGGIATSDRYDVKV